MEKMDFDGDKAHSVIETYRRQGWFQAMDEVYLLLKQYAEKNPYAPKELTDAEQYVVDGMTWLFNKRIEEKKNEIIKNDGKEGDANRA